MPPKSAVVRLDRAFSPQEMKRIRKGLVPQQMEDKWFIYWKDGDTVLSSQLDRILHLCGPFRHRR